MNLISMIKEMRKCRMKRRTYMTNKNVKQFNVPCT